MNIEILELIDHEIINAESFGLKIFFTVISILSFGLLCAFFYFALKKIIPLTAEQKLQAFLTESEKQSSEPDFNMITTYTKLILLLKAFLKEKLFIDLEPKTDNETVLVLKTIFDKETLQALEKIIKNAHYARFSRKSFSSEIYKEDVLATIKVISFFKISENEDEKKL